MKELSTHIKERISMIQNTHLDGLYFRRPGSPSQAELVEAIREIANAGDWSTVLYLLTPLGGSDRYVARTAANCIQRLLSEVKPRELLQLDERIRSDPWIEPAYLRSWNSISNSAIRKSYLVREYPIVVGLASFHRDGRVREAAVHRLAAMKSGFELPFLLLRLADWVPQVRLVAEKAVGDRLVLGYLNHFVDNLVLLVLVQNKERYTATSSGLQLMERIREFLKDDSMKELLLDGLKHGDYAVRRQCLRMLQPIKSSDASVIIELIMQDTDLMSRRVALSLSNLLPAEERRSCLSRLTRDPSPSIRRNAIEVLVELLPSPEQSELLENALLDQGSAVRAFARWKLNKLDAHVDVRQRYMKSLSIDGGTSHLAAAINGLGEAGLAEDVKLVLPMVREGRSRVRKAAIRTVAHLDGSRYVELFVELLTDSSPAVSLAACRALENFPREVNVQSLWQAFEAAGSVHSQKHMLMVVNRLEKWERLRYLLSAARQSDAATSTFAILLVETWYREFWTTWSYSKPTVDQREAIVTAAQTVWDRLSYPFQQLLSQCIAEWSREEAL